MIAGLRALVDAATAPAPEPTSNHRRRRDDPKENP